jgi:hypothetical protein
MSAGRDVGNGGNVRREGTYHRVNRTIQGCWYVAHLIELVKDVRQVHIVSSGVLCASHVVRGQRGIDEAPRMLMLRQ